MKNNNTSLETVPGAPNNMTIPIGHANIFHDAVYIISNGIVVVAFVALLFAICGAALYLQFLLLDYIDSRLGTNRWKILEPKSLTYINGHICWFIILATGIIIWAQGEGSVSFVRSFSHALGIGVIVLVFLLMVELAVMALCSCAKAVRLARRPATVHLELQRVSRPMASRDGTGTYSKVAMVPPDEDIYSKV